MAHPEWIPRLLRSIDERDWDTFVSHLTEDAEFRYGSGQTAVGRESIRSAADQAVSPFAAVEHELVDVWQRPDSTVVQGKVTYQWPDGHRQTLPFLNLFSMRDSLITKYLIFIDPSPLFRPRPGSMAAYMGVARAPFLLLPFMLVAAGAAAQ